MALDWLKEIARSWGKLTTGKQHSNFLIGLNVWHGSVCGSTVACWFVLSIHIKSEGRGFSSHSVHMTLDKAFCPQMSPLTQGCSTWFWSGICSFQCSYCWKAARGLMPMLAMLWAAWGLPSISMLVLLVWFDKNPTPLPPPPPPPNKNK